MPLAGHDLIGGEGQDVVHPGRATYCSGCPQGVGKLTSHSSHRTSGNRLTMAGGLCRHHNGRRMPSLLAITDNGSGRGGCGPPAWARLYCIHIQSCGSWPVRTGRAIRPGVVFGSQGSPAQSLGGDARCRCCDQPSSCAHAVISFRGISVLGGEYVVGPLLVADRQVPPWRAWVGRLFGSSLAVGYPPF